MDQYAKRHVLFHLAKAEKWNDLERISLAFSDLVDLRQVLKRLEIMYHLQERKDQGYLSCNDEDWELLKELLGDKQ